MNIALIDGIGPGLGQALCQKLLQENYLVIGLARTNTTANILSQQYNNFKFFQCDITDYPQTIHILKDIQTTIGNPQVYIHNAGYFLMQDFTQTSLQDFEKMWQTTVLSAINITQQILPSMLNNQQGTLLFTSATAAIKAAAQCSAFASAKFALRGLAQSLAREYGPKGIHIAHIILDGIIWAEKAKAFNMQQEQCLQPTAIAESYYHLIKQHRSAWTQELDLRPDCEGF